MLRPELEEARETLAVKVHTRIILRAIYSAVDAKRV